MRKVLTQFREQRVQCPYCKAWVKAFATHANQRTTPLEQHQRSNRKCLKHQKAWWVVNPESSRTRHQKAEQVFQPIAQAASQPTAQAAPPAPNPKLAKQVSICRSADASTSKGSTSSFAAPLFSEGYYREYYAYAALSRPCYQWRHLVLRRQNRNPIIKWRIFRYDTGSVSQSEFSPYNTKHICHLWLLHLRDQVRLIRAHMKRMDEVD